MADETDISKLLRLKRNEEPPPEYFDKFLRDFRRRQRAELIQRSTLEILWERLVSIAPSFRVPQVAYAAIAVMAVTASTVILAPQPTTSAPVVASVDTQAPTRFSLNSPNPVTIGDTRAAASRSGEPLPSHYVLPSRPVSNEQPLSF